MQICRLKTFIIQICLVFLLAIVFYIILTLWAVCEEYTERRKEKEMSARRLIDDISRLRGGKNQDEESSKTSRKSQNSIVAVASFQGTLIPIRSSFLEKEEGLQNLIESNITNFKGNTYSSSDKHNENEVNKQKSTQNEHSLIKSSVNTSKASRSKLPSPQPGERETVRDGTSPQRSEGKSLGDRTTAQQSESKNIRHWNVRNPRTFKDETEIHSQISHSTEDISQNLIKITSLEARSPNLSKIKLFGNRQNSSSRTQISVLRNRAGASNTSAVDETAPAENLSENEDSISRSSAEEIAQAVDEIATAENLSENKDSISRISAEEIAKAVDDTATAENLSENKDSISRSSTEEIAQAVDETATAENLSENKDSISRSSAEEIAQNSEKGAQNSEKVAQNSEKVAQNSEKVSQNSEKVAQNPEEVAQNAAEVDTSYEEAPTTSKQANEKRCPNSKKNKTEIVIDKLNTLIIIDENGNFVECFQFRESDYHKALEQVSFADKFKRKKEE